MLTLLLIGSTLTFAATNVDTSTEDSEDDFGLFNVEGYRLFRYRSPTPKSSEHATTLTTSSLLELLEKDKTVVLLDVQPLLWNRVFIQNEPRLHIPGSIWLPNVGRGELEPEWETYFRSNLAAITSGNKQRPLVIYCRADCWMSWNALKRASSWGYSALYWYRNGSDGWIEDNMDTSVATPVPFNP
ncbi:rhodanese-like domain-containing protein [Neptuniibacter pectenicola]|uniref:Rhodanese-like domain-containing protein n=1 Tax=Neptuniibacter pectenicola TaxID=1806669 RepID=A0ABU9TW38_9GAMM